MVQLYHLLLVTQYPQSFYHKMKNDIVGNAILYLDIPLPSEMKMGCHPSIRPHLKRVSPKISDLLISNGIVQHPTSKFSMVLKPMDQIPLWCNKNNTDVDGSTIGDDNDDSNVPDRDKKPKKLECQLLALQHDENWITIKLTQIDLIGPSL